MSTIVTRAGKGTPLTNVELDANFTNLNSDKAEKSANLSDLTNAVTARTNLGLSNVDNTADSAKAVASAAKLTTARTINGTTFDGSANISFSTDATAEGASNLYFTLQRVRDTVLTGFSTASNAVVSAADSVLAALGKLQAQISERVSWSGATGSAKLPAGTTAQRDVSAAAGFFRFNTTNTAFEGFNGTAWAGVGGASGGGGNPFVYENDQTVTVDYTITSGKNGMTAGPITINSGITVTVPSGSVWTIV